jgi:hypothetical protein
MKPRQDLVDNGFCLAEPGRQYLVYLDSPGTVNVRVSGGTYRVRWINARNTSDMHDGGTTTTGQRLVSPQDADDSLLYLTRQE